MFVYMYPAQQPLNSCAEIYEIGMYTIPPETISTTYFTNTSHQYYQYLSLSDCSGNKLNIA